MAVTPEEFRRKLPASLADLPDDPFRSLAALVRKAGGYAKTRTPYSEFMSVGAGYSSVLARGPTDIGFRASDCSWANHLRKTIFIGEGSSTADEELEGRCLGVAIKVSMTLCIVIYKGIKPNIVITLSRQCRK